MYSYAQGRCHGTSFFLLAIHFINSNAVTATKMRKEEESCPFSYLVPNGKRPFQSYFMTIDESEITVLR